MRTVWRTITPQDLDEFERRISNRLPRSYRDLLIRSNGDSPSANIVDEMWHFAKERFAGQLLPFASDSGASLFCLDLDRGPAPVVFCDVASATGQPVPVSDRFDQFLASLRVRSRDEGDNEM